MGKKAPKPPNLVNPLFFLEKCTEKRCSEFWGVRVGGPKLVVESPIYREIRKLLSVTLLGGSHL